MKESSLIIKEIRADLGLSISEFARQLGTHRQTIQDIEAEKRKKIPQELAIKIQEKYSYSMVFLMTGEGEKYAKADTVKEPAASYGAGILENMAKNETELKAKVDFLIDQVMKLNSTVQQLEKKLEAA